MMRRRCAWLWLALSLAAAGCANVEHAEQPQTTGGAWLAPGGEVGQTFVAQEAGLNALAVYLEPEANTPLAGQLVLRLLAAPGAPAVLAEAHLPAEAVTQAGYYHFTFAPQPDSHRKDYYAALTLAGEGRLRVGTGPGPSYRDGALYQDGAPQDAQLAFGLAYAPGVAAAGVVGEAARWLGWLALGGLLLVVPGAALLGWLWPVSAALSWGERLGLAVGLGAGPYPLLLLWSHLAGWHLGAWNAWLPLAAGALGLAALAWRGRAALNTRLSRPGWQAWRRAGAAGPDAALVVVLVLVALTRWWAARGLDLPLWGDSVQHTMVVQLLLDHGGLFETWAPYAEFESFTYHFGFHSLVAAFHWLAGLPAAPATLWVGQILNVLAVVVVYPLGARVGGSRWGGVAAVLAAGLLSPHPAYYVNWGRYTQLAGQVLLPAAVYLTWALAGPAGAPRRGGLVALAALAVGALALTHYRVLIMYGLFVAALLLVHWRDARRLLAPLAGVAVGSVLLALPWLLRTLGGPMAAFTGRLLTLPPTQLSASAIGDTAGLPDPRVYPLEFWLLAGLGLVAGWRWRRPAVWVLLVWWVLLVLGAHPNWLGLPGAGVLTNFAVLIAGYLGGALMAGAAAAWLDVPAVRRRWPAWLLLAVLLAVWGTWQRAQAVDVGRGTAPSRADQRAAAWMRQNLPAEALVLTRAAFGYSGTVAVGADGGAWLPLLAGRAVTTPPITYTTERGPGQDYRAWVEALPRTIDQHGLTHPDVLVLLRERGVTHVYVGLAGEAAADGPWALAPLLASEHFEPVYYVDRVRVFVFRP